MKEDSRFISPQIQVENLPHFPGYVDLLLDVVGFVAIDSGKLGDQHEGIYACDKHDSQTYKRYISIETNYLGASGSPAERIAAENGVKLIKEGGCGDFGVTLPFDSSKELIRGALDKLVAAVVAYRSQLRKNTLSHAPSKLDITLEGEDAQILVNLSERFTTSINDIIRKALRRYKEQVTQNDA